MTSACASNISIQKNNLTNRRKSCDTTCSSNSSCFLQKRKPINPLASSLRSTASRTNGHQSFVRQRVMSAKMIKLRSLQSQLNDANYHLMEQAKENRALKNLQRRQDKALKNYEGVDADLPRLIKSHEEENRFLQEKNKSLKKSMKELYDQVKIKDEELIIIRDQFKHLTNLTKDKNLIEREKLLEQLLDAKSTVDKYATEIGLLNRKLALESKNCKQKLNTEYIKHKRCQKELTFALGEIDRLNGVVEGRDKLLVKRRNYTKQDTKASSLVNLTLKAALDSAGKDGENSDTLSCTSSDIKLERIENNGKDSVDSNNSLEMMKSPTEKIKARLSSGKAAPYVTRTDINTTLKKLSMEEDNLKKGVYGLRTSRPNSTKLVSIKHNVEDIENPKVEELDPDDSGDSADDTLTEKNDSIVESKIDEDKLLKDLQETDAIDNKLRDKKINDIVLDDTDFELVNKIWSEEFTFRKTQTNDKLTDKEPSVALDDKKKLLATLRAIDNGKSIDSVVSNNDIIINEPNNNTDNNKKHRLIKELFG